MRQLKKSVKRSKIEKIQRISYFLPTNVDIIKWLLYNSKTI